MMRSHGLSLATCLLAVAGTALPAGAQDGPKVKLASMVKEAAGNPSKLFAAAQFAKANKLEDDATELLNQVVHKQPDHKAANEALGHQFKNDKWQAEVDGIWVDVAKKADALQGIFHHAGQRVNKWEKTKMLEGFVRHKWTGELIAAADKEKSDKDMFPLKDGKWGSVADADKLHSDRGTPWIIRTQHCYVVSTLPYNTIAQQIWRVADSVFPKLQMICGGGELHPDRRPVVWVMPSTAMYVEFGDAYGGGESAHGAFHTSADEFTMRINGSRRPVAAANWGAKGWGPYYVRHAAALAITHSYLGKSATRVPSLFYRAMAGYSSRLYDPAIARFFGTQHKKAGPPEDMEKFMKNFRISGDNPNKGKGTNDYNIFQAGLLIKFCMEGGDKDCTDAMMAVTKAIHSGKGVVEAITGLSGILGEKTEAINAYLDRITG